MFRELLASLKSYEKEFESWQPHHFLEAKSETLKKAVETSLMQEPTLDYFLHQGTEVEAVGLLELLREEVPMMTVATLKGILDALYKHEALQEEISHDLVRWYRKQGWKFPQFRFEKIEGNITIVEGTTLTQTPQQLTLEDGQPRDNATTATGPGEGKEASSESI